MPVLEVTAGNIYNAVTAKDSATKKKEAYRGGTKLGLVGGGAATGALIGSAVPVIGTLAGGLIGAWNWWNWCNHKRK